MSFVNKLIIAAASQYFHLILEWKLLEQFAMIETTPDKVIILYYTNILVLVNLTYGTVVFRYTKTPSLQLPMGCLKSHKCSLVTYI